VAREIDENPAQSPLNGWMSEPKWKEIGVFSQVAFDQDIEGESDCHD